jgi:NAD(P)-dependent dehydrogenase (short-subunit alcohol dehydrogenase family)
MPRVKSDIPAPRELFNFREKTVLVTGAGSGLGSGIALRFAEAGAKIIVHYRSSADGARALAAKIQSTGGSAIIAKADLSKQAQAERLVAQAAGTFAGLDVVINNAGIYPLAPLLDMTEAQWNEVIAANLSSVHFCTQAAAKQMLQQGRAGAIVNIASIEAENPAPQHSHYNAAKAAVLMYTRSAAAELGPHGIRVNAVSPGLIHREGLEQAWPEGVSGYMKAVALGRLGRADDVADACLFLASPAARWITGANLVVDGGVMTHRIF